MRTQTKLMLVFIILFILFCITSIYINKIRDFNSKSIIAEIIKERSDYIDKILDLKAVSINIHSPVLINLLKYANFIRTKDEKWASENIDTSLNTLEADSIWIYDSDFKIVYSVEKIEGKFLKNQELQIPKDVLIKIFKENDKKHFFFKTTNGLLEVFYEKIKAGENSDTALGYLIIGSYWTKEDVAWISELLPWPNSYPSLINAGGFQDIKEKNEHQNGNIIISRIFYQWDDKPVAELEVHSELVFYSEFIKSIKEDLTFSISFVILFLLVIFLSILVWVTTPLSVITQTLHTEDTALLIKLKRSRTEFGQISSLICRFFDQKKMLTDEITVRKRTEEALRESEERFKALFENAPDGILLIESETKKLYLFNNKILDMLGYVKDEMSNLYLCDIHKPEDILILERFAKYNDNITYSIEEIPVVRKNQSTFFADISIIQFIYDKKIFYACIYRDITLQKRFERLKEMLELVERSNKELEQFAYVASHDLQEPLRKIIAFGDLLKTEYYDKLDKDGFDYIKRMTDAASRMKQLINALLQYSRLIRLAKPFEEVDLKREVKGVISDLEVIIKDNDAEIEVGNLPVIDADPIQMRQLFQNIISNAIKFRKKDMPIKINITSRIIKEELVEIKISDNGIGIEEKYLDQVFTLFRRLHPRGKYEGVGIGLAICEKIVKHHDGKISAQSKFGEGTTFILLLPKAHGKREFYG